MSHQTIENGPNHHHPKVGPNGVDSEKLSPNDFYWWSIEQAGGSLEDAVRSVDSPESALKFAVGMQQECVASAQRNHRNNSAQAIGSKIEEALVAVMQPGGEHTPEHAEKNDIWRQALNEYYGTTSEISLSAESIAERLDKTIGEIADVKNYIEKLVEQADEQTRQKFSLDDEHVEALTFMADGYTAKEHALEMEARDTDGNERPVSSRQASHHRDRARKALKATTIPHAIRLGIEYGAINYDRPSEDKLDTEIDPLDRDILDLYSRGFYAQDIAKKKAVEHDIVEVRLVQMVKDFSAKNRQHLIKRAFEEGALAPDEHTVPYNLQESLRLILQTEQDLISARNHIAGFRQNTTGNEPVNPHEATEGQEGITLENISGQYSTIKYILGEQSEVAGKIIDDTFALHGEVYGSKSPILHPLSSGELKEAELASEGVRLIDRTTGTTARLGMTAQRMSMLEKIGTKSMANAVRIMIDQGMLPVQWTHPSSQVKITDPFIVKMMEFASRGGGDSEQFDSTEKIAPHLGHTSASLVKFVRQAKSALSAKDWASLTRRGFEEGVLIPSGPLGDLQNAQQQTVKAREGIASAGNILLELDADELIDYLFPPEDDGLSDIERRELQRMAQGISVKDALIRDKTTYGAIRNRREHAKHKLGAKTLTEAVAIAIEKGKIDTSSIAEDSPEAQIDKEIIDVFAELAKGALAQEIAYRKGIPRPTMYSRLQKARRMLSATDNPHAIAILLSKNILTPSKISNSQ